jgi:hypothetical protein
MREFCKWQQLQISQGWGSFGWPAAAVEISCSFGCSFVGMVGDVRVAASLCAALHAGGIILVA